MRHVITCRECRQPQSARAAAANGARCVSPICYQPICLFCGCSPRTACHVRQPHLLSTAPDYCTFFTPGACTNPECVERAYHAVTPEQLRAAQAYYSSRPRPARRQPTPDDLRDGAPLDEPSLTHIILDHLMTEAQALTLSSLDIDCFALIEGTYPESATAAVGEIFSDWNARVGREYFACGANLLAAA